MIASRRTQVAIVGAGPSGLLLGAAAGEGRDRHRDPRAPDRRARARPHPRRRARAGLRRPARRGSASARGCTAKGCVHDGFEIALERRRHRIDMHAPDRRQDGHGLRPDRADARPDGGRAAPPACRRLRGRRRRAARLRRPAAARHATSKDGVRHELACDFIAGCDGFHGVSRASVPAGAITEYEQVYPFGWLGVLSDTPPVSPELIYVNHERGFALCSMRSPTRSRYYLQVPLDREGRELVRRRASGRSCAAASTTRPARACHRPLDREEHRAAAQLRRRADALRPPVPRRRRRPHRAADRRQGPEPRGDATSSYLSRALVEYYREQSDAGLDAYSARCLRRVWRAERFSWWITSLLHTFPEDGAFGQRCRTPSSTTSFHSRAPPHALAENYVGLPLELALTPRPPANPHCRFPATLATGRPT